MNFILTENNQVISGPRPWSKFAFGYVLDELGISYDLPSTNDGFISISDSVKIYPTRFETIPELNTKIQQLAGPFYTFSETEAVGHYEIANKEFESVINELIAIISDNRYKKETAGVTIAVQDQSIFVDTARDNRTLLTQKFLLLGDNDTVQWKFPEGWVTLTKTQLGELVTKLDAFIQEQFDWEVNTVSLLYNAKTLEELDVIDITCPPSNNAGVI